MEEQKNITDMGGTMRLGAYECVLKQDSRVFNIYKKEHIQERHRHRYEFNNEYITEYERAGMKCVGRNPESNLVEIVEIPGLKWYYRYTVSSRISEYGTQTTPSIPGFCKSSNRKKEQWIKIV